MRIRLGFACLILCPLLAAAEVAPGADAAGFPHERSELRPDPAVRWGRLANGLRYCLMRNQQPREKVSLRLQVESGSLLESEAQRGLAHYLEHLAFNGTTNFPPGQLTRRLQPAGIAFGAHSNAHTSFDETVYKLDLPDPSAATIDLGLTVIADFAAGMLIGADEVAKERGVILAEMRDRNTPAYRQRLAEFAVMFPGLLLGERFPIGLPETVSAASPELIRAYYDAWYRPERMILAVVGAIDLDAMAQAVETRLGPLRSRATAVDPGMGTLVPVELGVLWHHDPESPSTALTLVRVRAEPNPHDSPQWRRQRLVESMASQVLSRRLSEIAEGDPEGPLISGEAEIGRWLDLVYASVGGDVRPGRGEAAVAVVEQALRRFVEHGPTEAELAVARANLLSGLERAVAQKDTRTNAALATALYDSVHEDEVFLSPEQARDLLAPLLGAITRDDLRAAFAAANGSGHRALLISGREPRPADAEARLRAAFAASGATAVAAPDAVADATWAYGERPVPGTVAAERAAAFDIVQLECANCVRINLLRTDYKPGEVLAQLRIDLPAGEPAQAGLRELAQAGYLRGGLGRHSRQELRTVLAGTTARVAGVEVSEDALIFPASCVPKDLERLLQQLRAWVSDPAWRPEAEAQAKSAWLEQLASLATDLEEQVERRFTSVAVGDDPSRRSATAAEASAADFAAVRAWLDPNLRDAPLTLTIVGDIDLAVTRELAIAYVGSLPVRRKGRVIADPTVAGVLMRAPAMPAGEHRLDVPGAVPRALISVAWPTDDYYDIAVTRRLGVLAQAMSERLRERLREELGQAYSPHVGRFASEAFDGFGYLRAEAAVAPEHADATLALILAVAARLHDQGVDADLLDQVKPPLVKNLAAQRQQNGYWLSAVAARSQEQPVRLEWSRGMEQDFAAIDATGLSVLAKRYLVRERALIVIGVCQGAAAPVGGP